MSIAIRMIEYIAFKGILYPIILPIIYRPLYCTPLVTNIYTNHSNLNEIIFRKTKPKNGHRHRKPLPGDGNSPGGCKNIGMWVAIGSNIGWLLILSYIVSMVHSEFANLAKEQTKLAASLKTLPDEWHEKAHSLEVNQSTLFHTLFELQQSVKNLTDDFTKLKEIVEKQQLQEGDVARVDQLQKSLGDFQRQLEGISGEVQGIREKEVTVTGKVEDNSNAIEYFRRIVVERRLNETVLSSTNTSDRPVDLQDLQNLTRNVAERLDKVNVTLSGEVQAEKERVDELEKSHRMKIDELSEKVTNFSTTSQEASYQKEIKSLVGRVDAVEKEIVAVKKGSGNGEVQVEKKKDIEVPSGVNSGGLNANNTSGVGDGTAVPVM